MINTWVYHLSKIGDKRKYVGCVSDVGSGGFVPTGIKSVGDVVPLVMFIPRGVKSRCS